MEIDKIGNKLWGMADFCSKCEPEYFDINLSEIALELEPGHSKSFMCEGCNLRTMYKDEKGLLYLGREIDDTIHLQLINFEEL